MTVPARKRLPLRLLLGATCLVLGVELVWLAVTYWPPAPLELAAAEVAGRADGGAELRLRGRGFERTLRAALLPEAAPDAATGALTTPRVPMYQCAASESVAVAMTHGDRLLTLDVRRGTTPEILGSLPLSRQVRALHLAGRRVVAGYVQGGGVLLDIADPAAPRQVAAFDSPLRINQMAADAGQLYAVGNGIGLSLLTIDQERVRLRTLDRSADCWRLAVAGRYLATGSVKGELRLYDVTAGGEVRLAGVRQLPQGIRGLALTAGALFVSLADGQLQEYPLMHWPQLRLAGALPLPGRPLQLVAAADRPQLYCALVGIGVGVVDVSRPGAPRVASWLPLKRAPYDLAPLSGRLLVTSYDGMQSIDLANLAVAAELPLEFPLPAMRGNLDLTSWGEEVVAHDKPQVKLLTAPGARPPVLALPDRAGVGLYAVREGGREPELIKTLALPAPAVKVFWRGGRLVVLEPRSLRLYSCEGTGNCRLVGRYPLPGGVRAMGWLDPGYVLVAIQERGLLVIDVRTPEAPALAALLPLPRHLRGVGGLFDVLADGTRAYVARGRIGVQVVDLATPAAPRREQLVNTPGSAQGLALRGGLLTVAVRDEGLFFIDVSAATCRPLGTLPVPTIPENLAVTGDELLVASANGALIRLPAPRRLEGGVVLSGDEARFTLPAGIRPGNYRLVLYDGAQRASLPVTLP